MKKIVFICMLAMVSVTGFSKKVDREGKILARNKPDFGLLKHGSIIYINPGIILSLSVADERNLQGLYNNGANILLTGNTIGTDGIEKFFGKIRSNKVLRKYKIIYRFNQSLTVFYKRYCVNEDNVYKGCEAPSWLSTAVRKLMSYPQTAGYYVFDEPAFNHIERGGRIHGQFQKKVYDVIRRVDRNKKRRPVVNTNVLYDPDTESKLMENNVVKKYINADYQDLILIQRYYGSSNFTNKANKIWNNTKILKSVSHMVILPAFFANSENKDCNDLTDYPNVRGKFFDVNFFAQKHRKSAAKLKNIAYHIGYSYFVYRTRDVVSYWQHVDMGECPSILRGVNAHIANNNYGIITEKKLYKGFLRLRTNLSETNFKKVVSGEIFVFKDQNREFQILASSNVGYLYVSPKLNSTLKVGKRIYRVPEKKGRIGIVIKEGHFRKNYYVQSNFKNSRHKTIKRGELFKIGQTFYETIGATGVGNIYLNREFDTEISRNFEVIKLNRKLPYNKAVVNKIFRRQDFPKNFAIRTTKSFSTKRRIKTGQRILINGRQYKVVGASTVGNLYLPLGRYNIKVGDEIVYR